MTWVLADADRGVWTKRKRPCSESSIHKRAKLRLAKWLEQAAVQPDGVPAYRIETEYPFSEHGHGIRSWQEHGFRGKPTRAQMRSRGIPALYICDIVLLEAGRVTTAVEVVHTHYTPAWKECWLQARGIAVYEVYASSVLALKGCPQSFDDLLVEVPA